MRTTEPIFVGLDLGTGGVRALAVNQAGQVLASASAVLATGPSTLPAGWHEQDPAQWWALTRTVLGQLTTSLRNQGGRDASIVALCVDGTSGTVLGVDERGQPVTPGMMYNDGRASDEAKELAAAAKADHTFVPVAGGIAASHAIAKVLWLRKHAPAQFAAARCFVHQADFIAGQLCGRHDITDYSNALKMGYDLISESWPAWLEAFGEIRQRLPRVVPPGVTIGTMKSDTANDLGFPEGTRIIAGATDGTAGFIASGARNLGDDNTTLGTTLVFKRLAAQPCIDPRGLIYCHKLPGPPGGQPRWLPGAASNTGCEWMTRASERDLPAMDAAARSRLPVDVVAYPLARQGERFPFLSAAASGFLVPVAALDGSAPLDPVADYAAHLQGTALVERLCYEALDEATKAQGSTQAQGATQVQEPTQATVPRITAAPSAVRVGSRTSRGDVYTTGGGSRSDVWTQLRADVTGRTYHRPACTESAFGAAVLAAAGAAHGNDLVAAITAMVRIERTFTPVEKLKPRYDELHERFKLALRQRGWLTP